jgi:hypothetical protein
LSTGHGLDGRAGGTWDFKAKVQKYKSAFLHNTIVANSQYPIISLKLCLKKPIINAHLKLLTGGVYGRNNYECALLYWEMQSLSILSGVSNSQAP